MNELDNIVPLKEFLKRYPWYHEGGIRHLIHNKNKNGFDKCVKKLGNRIFIDVNEFTHFLKKVKNENNSHY